MIRTTLNRQARTGAGVPGFNAPDTARKATVVREVKPTDEQIRRRAYELYLERQERGEAGGEADDWAAAERELSAKR